jgi:hypothetical protein
LVKNVISKAKSTEEKYKNVYKEKSIPKIDKSTAKTFLETEKAEISANRKPNTSSSSQVSQSEVHVANDSENLIIKHSVSKRKKKSKKFENAMANIYPIADS